MKIYKGSIKLTDAIITWFSKPNRYVKDPINVYEDKNSNWLPSETKDTKKICRTCLIGSVRLQSMEKKIPMVAQIQVREFITNLPEFKGYAHSYTTSQAKKMFVKIKEQLQHLTQRGE